MKFSQLKSFCLLFMINFCTTIIHCSQAMLKLCYIDTTEAVKRTKGNSGDIFNGLTSHDVNRKPKLKTQIGANKIDGSTLYNDIIKASQVNKKIRIFMISLYYNDGFLNIGPDFGNFTFDDIESINFTKDDGNKYDEYVKKIFNTSKSFKKELYNNSKKGYEVNIYYVTIDDENPADNGSNKKGSGSKCCCKR